MSTDYDKDLINREVVAICDHYLTDKRGEGKRRTYLCPACGDRNFEVDPQFGYAGCFDAACEAPTSTDALEIIAYFEGKSLSGEGFVMCLKKGYEILGIADPEEDDKTPPSSNGAHRQKAMTPRKDRASSHEKAMTPRADRRGGGEGVSDSGHGSVNGSGSQWSAATSSPPETSESALLEQPIQAWQENEDGTRSPVAAVVIREPEEPATEDAGEEPEDAELAGKTDRQTGQTDERQTAHEVFEELLKLCRREERDESFLTGRGLDEQTMQQGRFGSISKERCNYVVGKLRQKFSDEALLSVPGFRKAENGQFRFSLYSDYALIPYFDNEGYIRTVEGRFTGEEMGEYDKKYKALLNSAVHLYVHPRYRPDEVVAICEGAIGAMVAARYGFAVASIKGFRNYRRRVNGDGNVYTILPELEGVDFAGKTVVYIPDVDVKPKSYESVMKTVPDACHWMIERQGGIPKVAMLPEGAKDLDAWILSLDEEEREEKIEELLGGAMPVEQFKQHYLADEQQPDVSDDGSRDSHAAGDSGSERTEFSGFAAASKDGAGEDGSSGVEGSADDSEAGANAEQKQQAPSSNRRRIFGGSGEPIGEEEQSNEGSQPDGEQQPLDGFTEQMQEGAEESRKDVSGDDRTDEHSPSNRREYGTGSGEDSEPEKESGQQQDGGGGGEGGEDHSKEQTDSGPGTGPSLNGSEDSSEEDKQEDDTTEMETVVEESDYSPEPVAFEVAMKGEWALATVVYVAATVVLTLLIHVLAARYIGWVELPVWWKLGLAAFIAIWVTAGFRKLRKSRKAKKLRRHIEGTG